MEITVDPVPLYSLNTVASVGFEIGIGMGTLLKIV